MKQNNNQSDRIIPKIHTPSTLVGTYNNALRVEIDKELIFLKGLYQAVGKKNYRGYYYDRIKEEAINYYITAKTPEAIRYSVNDGNIYTFKGYLSRKIEKNGSINLSYVIAEVVSEQKKPISDEELKKIEILRKRSNLKHKDLERTLKDKLYARKSPKIILIYGSTGIVDQDVDTAMKEAVIKYNFKKHRINLSSKEEIIKKLDELNTYRNGYDVIAIVRGGGSGLEIFDDVEIAEKVIELESHDKPVFVTAIGHAQDTPLIGKIADKEFTTPTELGNYLREIVEGTEENMTRSKLIDERAKKTYEERISTLKSALEQEKARRRTYYIIIIILALMMGIEFILMFFL